jgi:hypothetical protein
VKTPVEGELLPMGEESKVEFTIVALRIVVAPQAKKTATRSHVSVSQNLFFISIFLYA